jgi:hypothetical protein
VLSRSQTTIVVCCAVAVAAPIGKQSGKENRTRRAKELMVGHVPGLTCRLGEERMRPMAAKTRRRFTQCWSATDGRASRLCSVLNSTLMQRIHNEAARCRRAIRLSIHCFAAAAFALPTFAQIDQGPSSSRSPYLVPASSADVVRNVTAITTVTDLVPTTGSAEPRRIEVAGIDGRSRRLRQRRRHGDRCWPATRSTPRSARSASHGSKRRVPVRQ